jgi:hypothetical protein
MKIRRLYAFFFFYTVQAAQPHYLIIHGTWCPVFSWHMPGGDFYEALVQAASPASVSFFIWSGHNSHQARVQAAQELVTYIHTTIAPDRPLIIVAHSHGANVAILASHILGQDPANSNRILYVYALGVPVHPHYYFPDMHVITYFYHFFSFNDVIQPVLGLFEREFPAHERIANIFITIDGQEPCHSQLHSPAIARWLPYLSDPHKRHCIESFEEFDYQKPGIIHFYRDKPPCYEIDGLRKLRQERDIIARSQVATMFRQPPFRSHLASLLIDQELH